MTSGFFFQECFYLPFSSNDVTRSSPLHKGDKVDFYVATDKRFAIFLLCCCSSGQRERGRGRERGGERESERVRDRERDRERDRDRETERERDREWPNSKECFALSVFRKLLLCNV